MKQKDIVKQKKGFTLLEVLLVLALVGLLLAITLVTFDPIGQIAEARNNQRNTDILRIESALTQYRLQEGSYPTGITRNHQEICDPDASTCAGYIDLSSLVPTYLNLIPQDPEDDDNTGGSGYSIAVDNNANIVSLIALRAESSTSIAINNPLPPEVVTPGGATISYDPDVQAMMDARASLGDPVPTAYAQAINDYVVTLKETPGMWDTITQLVVFAGATTVNGGLVPIKGITPTHVGLVAGDFNIKTGVRGNGTSKYIITGYTGSSFGQDNLHTYVLTTGAPTNNPSVLFGNGGFGNGSWSLAWNQLTRSRNSASQAFSSTSLGGYGISRGVSGNYQRMLGDVVTTQTQASQSSSTRPFYVLARSGSSSNAPDSYSDVRILVWAIGSATTLSNYTAPGNALQAALDAI